MGLEIGAPPECLSSGSLICTAGHHQETPGLEPNRANSGPISFTFQATRTVKRKPAPTVEIADEFVDCVVARLVN